jgi:hypothetical protein
MSDSECLCLLPSTALNQARGIWILNRVEGDNSGLWVPSNGLDDDGNGLRIFAYYEHRFSPIVNT